MSRAARLSGFPEWTPAERVVERYVIDELEREFSLHGFAEIETRAVEPVQVLAGDSDAAKEIYALTRLAEPGKTPKMGLHFDLTVPFARYVAEHQADLAFPFRRFQIQKVWRGERPQEGRYREFYQADIDVVGRETLPEHVDAEVAIVMAKALARLPIPPVLMRVNDRRLVEAFYRGVGVADVNSALRSVDKLAKIGADGVDKELASQDVTDAQAESIIALAGIDGQGASVASQVRALWESADLADGADEDALNVGLTALESFVEQVNEAQPGAAVIDLKIARGLDYYTGVVVETFLEGHEDLGSICSGGRYDSLVAGGGFPGVGMSIGVSRLVARMLSAELVAATRPVPTVVVVAVTDEGTRSRSVEVAEALRARGISAEVSPSAAKFGKQIQFAERRGIPFVWFPGEDGDEVKDIRSGDQVSASADSWTPPTDDMHPRVVERNV